MRAYHFEDSPLPENQNPRSFFEVFDGVGFFSIISVTFLDNIPEVSIKSITSPNRQPTE